MRTRYLKPGFFENEELAALPASTRLLFAGLWLVADKAGRLRDRPARIKGELFPYDNTNVERGLKQLADAGFIKRYDVDGQRLIWIPTWDRHQHPHPHEPASTLPRHEQDQCPDNVITSSGPDPSINSYSYANANEDSNGNANEDVDAPSASAGAKRPLGDTDVQGLVVDFPRLNVLLEASKFRDYNKAKGRRLKDEVAGFRNWLRKAEEFATPPQERTAKNELAISPFARFGT